MKKINIGRLFVKNLKRNVIKNMNALGLGSSFKMVRKSELKHITKDLNNQK